ncbi:DUF1405 domain-containing protein [Staphylococcus lugdunensis]|uniref:DUF1405 domain-containing protein n=2 Tax=Staphylococcus lugdunensis TaxID=28035 RepID=A0A4Q9WC49_STALU|nr:MULTISPECIES: DUF1405 domain-containing protein [Staphylococcus]AMG60673.1 hypothetical protein AL499_01590 [Staphylococcus lugdunensis]ARJ11488.1 hypothetical protein B7466_06785 [Staphylococcus lugdunensis]AST60059.1 DUF1405 domain-containing protein [Staphylococcus lugdunensis]ATG68912.1 DUF1405 domain-containing protein [Staphylococcus lugdunensis]ATN14164.1 DUF1405 domain-containing protein [Staphylococcus lugdunensis]
MRIREIWELSLYYKPFLLLLLFCNVLGALYGYYWYAEQLSSTTWYFLPFVPDSPTASLFLCLTLYCFLNNKRCSIVGTLAFLTLFKYGIWAVSMNILMFIENHDITINGLLLLLSHAIMAMEACYIYPRLQRSSFAIAVGSLWLFINDAIDYLFEQYPIYDFIAMHLVPIAVFTVCLSFMSILLYYIFGSILKFKLFA